MNQDFSVSVVSLGEKKKEISVATRATMPVIELRRLIAKRHGLLPINVRLVCNEKQMEDGNNVETYGLQARSKIFLIKVAQKPLRVNVIWASGESRDMTLYSGDTAKTFLERFQKKVNSFSSFELAYGFGAIDHNTYLSELELVEDDTFMVRNITDGGDRH